MRNIEEIAEEEELRVREIRHGRFQILFRLIGFGLAIWGWILFTHEQMGKGSLALTVSFLLWGLSWGVLQVFRPSSIIFFAGLPASVFGFLLYFNTRLPFFYWGRDPAFWLSVHAGAVNEPFWSPLSYLLGQAICFLAPASQYSILPVLSAAVLGMALFFLMSEYFFNLKNKNLLNVLLSLLVLAALTVSGPFWNAGTMASGMVASLGLLLFLFQRSLLTLDEKPCKALCFLLGLLASVHPLWGFLGFLNHMGSLDLEGRKPKENIPPLLLGLTPYLWVAFRAGRTFPSWGGSHPFLEMLGQWRSFLPPGGTGGVLPPAFKSMGWTLCLLAVGTVFLWFFNFFKWKVGGKIHFSALNFWVWILAGFLGVLFYSPFSENLGPTILWFAAGLGGVLLKLLEKGAERRQATFFSGDILAWMGAVCLLLAFALAWLPGQRYERNQFYFPQQHAMNLLRNLEQKSMLVCRDPYDAVACRETRLMDPIALNAVILDERYLDQRWYVTQVIQRAPEILFSGTQGPVDQLFKNMVLNNRDIWDIHWDLPALPPDWKELKAFPAVITQQFQGKTTASVDPESVQYRYDLAGLPEVAEKKDNQTRIYFSRYVTGFNELGKYLMDAGRYSAAIHAFERAAKLDPAFLEPQTYLAQMYSKQNILEAARLEFEKTLKTHPQKISALMKDLGEAQKLKNEAKTVMLLDQMIHLSSELADAQYQLSKIYDKAGRPKEAKALLESSVQLNPQQLEAQMTLGRLMARMGNRIKSEEAFRAVLEIDPQNKEAQVELWKLLNKP